MVGRYASYILIGIGAVFSFGVPSFYRENAPWISGAWLVALLGIIWNMLRGYRSRVLRPTRPRLMLAYLVGFLFLDHVLNFVCFVNIEVPLEFPMASAGLGMFPFYAVVVITASHLLFSLANWVVLGGTLRVMGSRCAWSLAARITLYSLPVTLLTALPGADSWLVGVSGLVILQAFTLWRLAAENSLDDLHLVPVPIRFEDR